MASKLKSDLCPVPTNAEIVSANTKRIAVTPKQPSDEQSRRQKAQDQGKQKERLGSDEWP